MMLLLRGLRGLRGLGGGGLGWALLVAGYFLFFSFLFWIDGFEGEEREGGREGWGSKEVCVVVVVVVVVDDTLDVYTIWIKPCSILQYYGSPWLSGMMADAIGTIRSPHAAGCCELSFSAGGKCPMG